MLHLSITTVLALPHTAHLGVNIKDMGPRSKFAARNNGSSIPAGGAVWPTAIYWATLQVGTPPVSFPACIDSGSGDLDISAKGCQGCVTKAPNHAYDHTASSTSSAAFPYRFSNTYETCDLKHPTKPCTIAGKLYKDDVSFAGLGPVQVRLGAIDKQDANFDQFKVSLRSAPPTVWLLGSLVWTCLMASELTRLDLPDGCCAHTSCAHPLAWPRPSTASSASRAAGRRTSSPHSCAQESVTTCGRCACIKALTQTAHSLWAASTRASMMGRSHVIPTHTFTPSN